MIMLKGARLIEPMSKTDDIRDILISDRKIQKIGEDLEFVAPLIARAKGERLEVIDCTGLIVAPAFIGTNINFDKQKFDEDNLLKVWQEAIKGGFANICLMPSERNIIDNEEEVLYLIKKSKKLRSGIRAFASISKELKGEELTDMRILRDAGAVAFSDGYKVFSNNKQLREAMFVARRLKMPISLSVCSKDKDEASLLKDIANLVKDSMVNVLVQHISTKEAIEVLREIRKKGIKLSAEISPYHFSFSDADIDRNNASSKYIFENETFPNIKSEEDKKALLSAIKDGLIDIIASNHSPYDKDTKKAHISLETCLSLGLMNLVDTGLISMTNFIAMLTSNVARFYDIDAGFIREDKTADLVVFDPNKKWVYDNKFENAKYSPIYNKELKGKVVLTIAGGLVVYKDI